MTATADLERARDAFARKAWAEAFEAYARADAARSVAAEDLERWSDCAHLAGEEDAALRLLDRAHGRHLDDGSIERAAYCAAWAGLDLAGRGEMAQASGWFGRARRLVGSPEGPSVVEAYLVLADALRQAAAGETETAFDLARRANEAARRFGDADLAVLSLQTMGRVLLVQARVDEGLALLDEAMVAVASDPLSPRVPGIVYCSVISACHAVYSLRRAYEWTEVLTRWCDGQPELVAYTGECRVNRSEILRLHGAWREAAVEADLARERLRGRGPAPVAAAAEYQRAEGLRLVGAFDEAERAYRDAHRLGRQPQPGLALLRLARGGIPAAAHAIRRVCGETTAPLKRARLLPAAVDVLIAAGAPGEARHAAEELERIATAFGTVALRAMAAQAAGTVALAEGNPEEALRSLRRSFEGWRELAAPYHVARVRMLVGRACAALGDEEAAGLEFEAAGETFEALGAHPDLERVRAAEREAVDGPRHGLTPRQLEVLRAMADGATNRSIADRLAISQRTVDRHVSNIFDKLGVGSRAEATAYAVRHHLV